MFEFFNTVYNDLTGSESMWFMIFHLICFLIGLITGYFIWGRHVKRLEAEAVALNNRISLLEGKNNELSADLERKETHIGELSAELNIQREKNKSLENEKGDLHTELLLLKGTREEQDALILTLNNDKEGLNAQLSAEAMSYKSSIGGLNADLDAKATNLSDLQAKIGKLESDVSAKAGTIGDLEIKLSKCKGINTQLNADLSGKAGNFGNLDAKLGNLQNLNTGLQGDLDATVNDIGALRAKVGNLETDVTAKTNTIGDLEAKIGDLEGVNAKLNTDLNAKSSLVAGLEGNVSSLNKLVTGLEEKNTAASMAKTLEAKPVKLTKEEKAVFAGKAADEVKGLIGSHIPMATVADKDNLKVISGVGPFIETKLNNLGIWTYEQISYFDKRMVDKVTDAIQFFPGRIERDDWVFQAKGLSPRDMSAAAAASEKARAAITGILGTHIPVATAADKDDLKIISGVGPFIETKLNDLGIYTYEQVSLFDEDFIEKVTDAIEFFPGRISRDGWVDQATTLFQAK